MSREIIIKIITREKGKATMIRVFSRALRPPENRSDIAIRASRAPQTIFFLLDGLSFPFSDNIAKTNVAESADVMKNETIKTKATMDMTLPKL